MSRPLPIQLAELLVAGRPLDRHGQGLLYKHYYGFAASICRRYLPDPEVALEAVNDGFLKVFQELPRFDAARYPDLGGSLTGWLHRIMVRTAIDRFRAEHRHALLTSMEEGGPDYSDGGHTPLDALAFEELLHLIGQLSPACQAVFNLYVIDGYSHEEIAAQLHMTVGASKTNLSKARAGLKQLLKRTHHHAYAPYVR
ncbi:sigma-70 family RNA polymerase sigma factor [Hymenobacter setariae]|uniref:Sigma-70 family RNA polymerase sigma factor n=1 Tax=Hymenobacter setariae TaxID=2594794 RepID=A0A558C402_9BACT|nr:sigma-70 family RNA polymerase sigma factor [Hymenobacter setariae]TVT43494.1 sigma-70 family RNA polymerase sigma factor [Hymenobacter setariae]